MLNHGTRIRVAAVCAAVLMVLGAGLLGGQELVANCVLHGRLMVRNTPVPVGTVVEAYVGGTLLADSTVQRTGYYEIAIPSDDPVTFARDGWLTNDEIRIHVAGEEALPTVTALEGRLQVDLAVPYISDVRKSTWGKIKALFR